MGDKKTSLIHMSCPRCNSSKIRKFGHQDGRQRFKCNKCGRVWRESSLQRGYSPEVKQLCIKMYLNGMGFRSIERVTEIHHTTIIDWVREAEAQLTEDEEAEPPKVAELDGQLLQVARVGGKRIFPPNSHGEPAHSAVLMSCKPSWAVARRRFGSRQHSITINQELEVVRPSRSLWERVESWGSKWYMTDGYCVYANFIDRSKHLVMKKTKITRVEGENTRLRHYLSR